MPARSNKRQAVVYFVKKHRAPAGAQVTESEFLHDAQTGEDREVDVVVRYVVGDDPVVISAEVTDRKSRADVTWVDSMLMKHSHMPTGHLLLVSWSGFTKGALAKVAAQGGRVEALTPERDDGIEVRAKFMHWIRTSPTRVGLRVRMDGGEPLLGNVSVQTALFLLADGTEVGTVGEMIERFSRHQGERFSKQVYYHENRESLTHYTTANDALEPLGLAIKVDDELTPVLGLHVIGELSIEGHELPWEFWRLGPTLFAMAEVEFQAMPMLCVLSPQEDGSTTLSWRPLA